MDRMKPQPDEPRAAVAKLVPSALCIIADLFDALMKMPGAGGYDFTYSYKPSKAATHVQAIRDGAHSGWASGLMQKLKLEQTPA